jgi:hypothetical protein
MFVPAGALMSISLLAGGGGSTTKSTGLPDIVRSLGKEEPTALAKQKQHQTHLVVHFDINETVLVGDDAGGDTREDSLNKIIAKSAFCKIPAGSSELGKSMDDSDPIVPTHWWDGSVIGETNEAPPLYTGWNWPDGCCPYYRTAFKKRSKIFVEDDHGKPYAPLYHEMERLVAFNHPRDGGLPDILSHLIPALFESIQTLTQRPQPVRFVFRTFGTDLPEIADAVSAFSRGQHPDYPDFCHPNLELPRDLLYRGRWTKDSIYQLLQYDDPTTVVASGDAAIIKFLESKPMCGINDDYEFWAANEWEPWAGKPVWVSTSSPQEHHILLDDNIHNIENDSIASVRREQADGTYEFLTGSEIQDMQGLHLIRVPTIEPILNRDWFVEQLDKAQERFAEQQQNLNIN